MTRNTAKIMDSRPYHRCVTRLAVILAVLFWFFMLGFSLVEEVYSASVIAAVVLILIYIGYIQGKTK